MPPIARRPIREMSSQRRRHPQGLSQMDLHQIEVSFRTVLRLLVQVATIPILACSACAAISRCHCKLSCFEELSTLVYQVLDPIGRLIFQPRAANRKAATD